jgi:hypothetical protein
VNQWQNPRKCGTGSNLVDMGRAAVRAELSDGEAKVWNRTSQVPPACSYNLMPVQKEGERVSCAVAAAPPSSSTSPSPSR